MQQTPIHENFNQAIVDLMPHTLRSVVEVGSSSGALARAYKALNPACHYVGMEIDSSYAEQSRRYCDEVINTNIEQLSDEQIATLCSADCWIFGDVLEHLYDPWKVLQRIRQHSRGPLQIIACIPNAQHWSVQSRLCSGEFVYQNQGILDRTHIRWFTRLTMLDLFAGAGFEVLEMQPLIYEGEPMRELVLPAIKAMAAIIGADPQVAADDAQARQYVMRAVPKGD